ncbi:uncharacterized protein METZ01_LOCUS384754 [marine metagenome]|uniref:Uncharacterized protein n=1 Tax=marine metagenome TaxID=408172 RepID=A0A382UC87_9ZZZZ
MYSITPVHPGIFVCVMSGIEVNKLIVI